MKITDLASAVTSAQNSLSEMLFDIIFLSNGCSQFIKERLYLKFCDTANYIDIQQII